MKWRVAVEVAIKRQTRRNNNAIFTNKELLSNELAYIYVATQSDGDTPNRSLSETLQRLRDARPPVVAFIATGIYNYLHFNV